MKKLFTFWMLILLPFCISAQTDTKAAEILDNVLEDLSKSSGIRADFGGSETGFLLLKGEKFDKQQKARYNRGGKNFVFKRRINICNL